MSPTKILLVDDKEENLVALSRLIEAPDIEIITKQSGEEALELLLHEEVALALLDVQMPDVDGFELAELMRQSPRTRHIPIIFVTAGQAGQHLIFKGYDKGAVDFLFKPLDPHIVKSKVRVFVELDQNRKKLVHQYEDMKDMKEEMEKLKELAESANHAKSSFLATISHEIRTPLGVILGFAEMLTDGDPPEDERLQYARTIRRNGHLLMEIVSDILDLSKIEAGRLEVEKVDVNLPRFLQETVEMLKPKAEEKGLYLACEINGSLPETIQTDSTRFRQVLVNMIGNAIKFTHEGGVTVEASLAYQPGDFDLSLKVRVKDTGIGMSKEQKNLLFQPFIQGDSSTTRKFGGTGLGLALSKRLSKALGGDLSLIESVPEQGTTFEVRLDLDDLEGTEMVKRDEKSHEEQVLTEKEGSTSREAHKTKLPAIRVLVVDDSADNQALISCILKKAGAKVELAHNGLEGFEQALKTMPDVVLMDVQMPVLDGYAAAKRLREEGFSKPIIALTAHALQEVRQRCLAHGCNDHVTKPVKRKDLIKVIQSHLKPLESKTPSSQPTLDLML